MMTIDEIYFLVRVGSWDQAQLQAHIDQLVQAALEDQAFDLQQESNSAFDQGFETGRHQGYSEGKHDGYEDGYHRGQSEGYDQGLRDGERASTYKDRW